MRGVPMVVAAALVVSYRAGGGVAFQRRVADQLPPGAVDSIRQDNSSYSPEPFASEQRHVIELTEFMVGEESVEVTVRPRLR